MSKKHPMPLLTVRQEQPETLLDLLGYDEDSITLAIAWALAHSPRFLREFLAHTVQWRRRVPPLEIRVQDYEQGRGITDLELVAQGEFHLIVEAKRGWVLPGRAQLSKYARRASFAGSPCPLKRIVTLSECSSLFAQQYLPTTRIRGIPVSHTSWSTLFKAANAAHRHSRGREHDLLRDVLAYFGRIMKIQKNDTSLVYVVSLSTETPRGWELSWSDVVAKKHIYFHPIAGTWPKEPPTYIAFRHHGRLQSIHFIRDYKAIYDLHEAYRGIPSRRQPNPLFLYRLGPAIRPQTPVRTGSLYRNARVWCTLDLLLTSKTIAQARALTKKRFDLQ